MARSCLKKLSHHHSNNTLAFAKLFNIHHRPVYTMATVSLSMMLLGIVYIISTLLVAASSGSSDAQPQKKQPNVVILFADNLAYDDVGTFQAATTDNGRTRSRTPRTDVLATEGLKLLHWNSPAVLCSASRAALLTGKNPVEQVYIHVFLNPMPNMASCQMKQQLQTI